MMLPAACRSVLLCLVCVSLTAEGIAQTRRYVPLGPTPVDPPPVFVDGPSVRQNPNPLVPLAAIVEAETNEATRIQLDISDGSRAWTVPAEGPYRVEHEVPVIRMRPGRDHVIGVTAIDRFGNRTVAADSLLFRSPDLPPGFPPLDIRKHEPSLMEPGPIAFAATVSDPDGQSGSWRVILSRNGDVLWYHRDRSRGGNMEVLRNGNLLLDFGGRELLVEIDSLGNAVASWTSRLYSGAPAPDALPVDTDSFHHEFQELPPGRGAFLLTLSTEARIYSDYPADEKRPSIRAPFAKVVGDVIIEFRRDGTIARETKLLDVLDPYRICYDSLEAGFWDPFYGDEEFPHVHDWAHTNSVILDPRDGNYIVSLRHQDAVVKIIPGAKDPSGVVWILGAPGRWVAPWADKLLTPIGWPFAHPFHQHAPELTPVGNLVLFDNGNYRAIPPTLPLPPDSWFSRAVEYRIDEVHSTVRQFWAYGGRLDIPQNNFFSTFLGDADPLPKTGNVLVTDGGKTTPSGVNYARIVEVTREDPAVTVFEMVIREPDDSKSWRVYRAEKLPRPQQ